MGGGVSKSGPAEVSTEMLQARFQLKNKYQGKAIKAFMGKLGISLSIIDKL